MSLKIGVNRQQIIQLILITLKRKKLIKFIILHYTGMKNESEAIKKLCDSKSKVSSHYFIKFDGKILNLVPDLYDAWHAGKSYWKNLRSINKFSIGIEIHNPGHEHGYKKFRLKQILSLKKLLKQLLKKYKIETDCILGHSDIAPNRKKDPGEKFPWKKLAKENLCLWHFLNEKNIKKFRKKKISLNDKNIFFNNLLKIGYSRFDRKSLITAFQRRFRQELINGKIDKECFLISKNLIKL